ncbi:DUF1003 domain-containing protein [Leptolyngbya sp. FACHB-16]|uniref:DUF1003 domain-containing protein n=1 Tax=unclassified Leptolyngbya TaxID=2650499 RepID=UPI001686FCA1|nr:DUF1003 domain-containing protein [Leptolyngbya sp. FACHB-16]MBD2157872.1 DUF1003 domain-containing protein [Leptolyngbya sp. FACHB-16]
MNTNQESQGNSKMEQQIAVVLNQPVSSKIKPPEKKPLTFGQKVADKLASKVGSWTFLIGQSTVLAGWIGLNLMPGIPHWDKSPFILLNLVFSFASAYTAPVVLMSQNRQSEEDRENANHNYQITLQAAQQLELLHDKLDAEYSKKLDELTALIKQQVTQEPKIVFVPTHTMQNSEHLGDAIAHTSIFHTHSNETVFVNVASLESLASSSSLDDVQVLLNR